MCINLANVNRVFPDINIFNKNDEKNTDVLSNRICSLCRWNQQFYSLRIEP